MDYTSKKRQIWLGKQKFRASAIVAFTGFLAFGGMMVFISIAGSAGTDFTSTELASAERWLVAVSLTIGCAALLWQAFILGSKKGRLLMKLLDVVDAPPPLELQRIDNAVNGIALASGVPRPDVTVVKDECLNAFTIPEAQERVHLCLTSGLLEGLSLEELTGVVAHEFAHIKNGDLDRFHVTVLLLSLLLRKRVRQKRWLALLRGLLPILLWTATAAVALAAILVFDPGDHVFMIFMMAGYIIFSLVFINFLLLPEGYSKEILEHRFSIDLVADGDSLGWTYNPAALASALRKCHTSGVSPALAAVNRISFVCTRPEVHYIKKRESGLASGYAYFSLKGIRFSNQKGRDGGVVFRDANSSLLPQQASVEHRLDMLKHFMSQQALEKEFPV